MREYTQMLPLWHLEEKLSLSDAHPSGLAWAETNGRHQAGDMAGKKNKRTGYYTVYLGGVPYSAHRIVYYLRTGHDPGSGYVRHTRDNIDKDNRKELVFHVHEPPKLHKRPYVKSGMYSKTHCN